MKINSVNRLSAKTKVIAGVNPVDRMLEIAARDDDTFALEIYYQAIEDIKGKDFAASCVIEALGETNFYDVIVSEYNDRYSDALTDSSTFYDLITDALDDGRSSHRTANNISILIEVNDKIYEAVHRRFCELVEERDTY